ncbi:hypothetical protein [Ferrovibrio sp.]|uniref:hypothetical protein n=1 Tax=Ferrovibrio sp. TaxID=1917215 RepID=UPI003D0E4457
MRRIVLTFFLLFLAAPLYAPSTYAQSGAELRGSWPAFDTRMAKPDPQPYPTGVDLGFVAGLPLALTRPASIQRADLPAQRLMGWPSLVATVENSGKPLTIRLIGVAARARPGDSVAAGQAIGLVADAATLWPGVANHITLEVYLDGRRVDPRPWVARLLPQGVTVQPMPPAQANVLWPQWALRAEAVRLAQQKDGRTALARLRAAMRLPAWKASNLDLAEDIGLAAQGLGDKPAEAAALRRALDLARAEIPYAQGQVPVALLGPVSAARSPASLYALEKRLAARLGALGPVGSAADGDDE